jgi:hypothetical protein
LVLVVLVELLVRKALQVLILFSITQLLLAVVVVDHIHQSAIR